MDTQNNQAGGQNNAPQGAPAAPSNHLVMAVLSYLGPLVIVSYITSKDNEFVKFHIKQGLALFGLEVIVWILGSMFWAFWMIANVINIATLVLSIVGIVNASKGLMKELPIVGKFASGFSI